MHEIHTIEELKAVIEGGFRYLYTNFKNQRIICHPIAAITFLPSHLEFIPQDIRKGIEFGWLLLYSNDGETWTYNFKEIYQNAMNQDGHFYISDWKLNILFNVEFYMMKEVVSLLTTVFDDFTLIGGFKWKQAEPGLVASYSFEEYFSE
jgi:hypothetical protein